MSKFSETVQETSCFDLGTTRFQFGVWDFCQKVFHSYEKCQAEIASLVRIEGLKNYLYLIAITFISAKDEKVLLWIKITPKVQTCVY